jgi:uncharacterized protein with PIN domain
MKEVDFADCVAVALLAKFDEPLLYKGVLSAFWGFVN